MMMKVMWITVVWTLVAIFVWGWICDGRRVNERYFGRGVVALCMPVLCLITYIIWTMP